MPPNTKNALRHYRVFSLHEYPCVVCQIQSRGGGQKTDVINSLSLTIAKKNSLSLTLPNKVLVFIHQLPKPKLGGLQCVHKSIRGKWCTIPSKVYPKVEVCQLMRRILLLGNWLAYELWPQHSHSRRVGACQYLRFTDKSM